MLSIWIASAQNWNVLSIEVNNISKYYGSQAALDDLSFHANEGEILGLLGPNGAGKTTTMKILSCFLTPDNGSASIYGLNPVESPLKVKSIPGYLPEHNPLYGSMYVRESLEFIAELHKLKNKGKRIEEVIEITGLGPERNKKIMQLSKGYKQRVGIAQAIIHKPKVLILDEPISGLDPNQIQEIRNLITELKSQSSVIFSSHILQEVESICDRVVILDKGKLVANDIISNVSQMTLAGQNIFVEFAEAVRLQDLIKITKDIRWEKKTAKSFMAQSPAGIEFREMIFDFAVANNNKILEMRSSKVSLESAFKTLTKNKES